METWKIIVLAILAAIVIGIVVVVLSAWGMYSDLVNKDVAAENAQGHVQSAYQRRADLLPNLVATVQGSADFEKSTLVDLTAMRSQAGMLKTQASQAKTFDEMQATDNQISGVLARLMVVVEAYPQIKSTDAFQTLQSQIEGTENRINTERNYYNDAVAAYKVATRTPPESIIAGMFGFPTDKWQMFTAKPGSDVAPVVAFNFSK
jgi:LemA protein